MKERLKEMLLNIKYELGSLIFFNFKDAFIYMFYVFISTLIVILLAILAIVSLVLSVLFAPINIFKKVLKNKIWFQNFTLWFRTYLEYKWNCMPNYDISKVRQIRKNGFKNATQKTLNRWAYWVYKNHRRK